MRRRRWRRRALRRGQALSRVVRARSAPWRKKEADGSSSICLHSPRMRLGNSARLRGYPSLPTALTAR